MQGDRERFVTHIRSNTENNGEASAKRTGPDAMFLCGSSTRVLQLHSEMN